MSLFPSLVMVLSIATAFSSHCFAQTCSSTPLMNKDNKYIGCSVTHADGTKVTLEPSDSTLLGCETICVRPNDNSEEPKKDSKKNKHSKKSKKDEGSGETWYTACSPFINKWCDQYQAQKDIQKCLKKHASALNEGCAYTLGIQVPESKKGADTIKKVER